MIKVKRTNDEAVETEIKGKAHDIAEELLNATVSIVESLVENGRLDKQQVNDFIDDLAQQVKDNIKLEEME